MRFHKRGRQLLALVLAACVISMGVIGAAQYTGNERLSPIEDAEGALVTVTAAAAFALGVAACAEWCDGNTQDLQKVDANETETEIYTRLSQHSQNSEIIQTSYDNYLQDTESVALMEAKATYIRELNNGTGEATARSRAKQAAADYYAKKQLNLLAAWNTSVATIHNANETAANTSGVSATFVHPESYPGPNSNLGTHDVDFKSFGTQSVTLTNGTTVTSEAITYNIYNYPGEKNMTQAVNTGEVAYDGGNGYLNVTGAGVKAPTSSYEPKEVLYAPNFSKKWSAIESQKTTVATQIDTFVDATYSSYQQGDINESDLVDPYLAAREYGPSQYDTWTLRTLSSMGIAPPDNISSIGHMNVTTENHGNLTGILLSESDTDLQIGTEYNAATLTGRQMLQQTTTDNTVEITGNFTITSAETMDGESLNSTDAIEYTAINYTTADTQEYQALLNRLANLTAKLNARQQNLRNSGGFGFGGLGGTTGVVVIAGIAISALLGGRFLSQ